MEWKYSDLFALVLFLVTVVLLLNQWRRPRRGDKQKPPGPPGWPVLGNIFDLGKNPHQSLYKLRSKYGPVLWLRLGFSNTLVIQSAVAAEEFFKHHDVNFCDRKVPDSCRAHNYDLMALSLRPYDSDWRFHRRFLTLQLLTSKRIDESAFVRRKCVDDMMQSIDRDVDAARARGETGKMVLANYIFVMTFNLIGNLLLSQDLVSSQSKAGAEFFDAMGKFVELTATPNAADLWPFLKGLDLQRIRKKAEREGGRTLKIVEGFVIERIEERKLENERKKDFLDALLEIEADGKHGPEKISTQAMLIMILEIFFGGSETTGNTIEWTMTELLHHPKSMKRAKEELCQVIGQKRKVEETDIDQLPYLQAMIKETMRLHPALPLLIPRNAKQDTNFMGYFIPKDTQVFVNVWGIGRDSDYWEDPMSFKPERFLGSDTDYKGHNFEYLPFGSGRRICAGILLAERVLHLAIASLLHSFDWELSCECTPETIDFREKVGISVGKLIPLEVIPKKIT